MPQVASTSTSPLARSNHAWPQRYEILSAGLLFACQKERTTKVLELFEQGLDQRGRLWAQFLPACMPELNPVQYLRFRWEQHELPNFCLRTSGNGATMRAVLDCGCVGDPPW